jgi:hypothetical protein
MRVDPNVCAVYGVEVVVNLNLQGLEDSLEMASHCPTSEATVDGFPLAVPLGQVSPRYTGLDLPKHGIDEAPG